VAKAELGVKRVCPVTGRKFYDLNSDPVVSPYSGQSYPRSFFEPAVRGAAKAAPIVADEKVEVNPAAAELVSLDEVEVAEEGKEAAAADDEVEIEDDAEADDTFLAVEEEADDDVADLIDGDIEDDEEA